MSPGLIEIIQVNHNNVLIVPEARASLVELLAYAHLLQIPSHNKSLSGALLLLQRTWEAGSDPLGSGKLKGILPNCSNALWAPVSSFQASRHSWSGLLQSSSWDGERAG